MRVRRYEDIPPPVRMRIMLRLPLGNVSDYINEIFEEALTNGKEN